MRFGQRGPTALARARPRTGRTWLAAVAILAPSIVAASFALSSSASGATLTGGTIDSFDDAPVTLMATSLAPVSDTETSTTGIDVLGGVRTSKLVAGGPVGTARLAIAAGTSGALTMSATGATAQGQLLWDGGGSGLGGVDLTAGGTLSTLVGRVVSSGGVSMTVTITSAGNACSTGTTAIAGGHTSTQRRVAAVIPFAALTLGGCSGSPSTPADVTKATAVQLVLTVPAGSSVSVGSFYVAALDHGDLPDTYSTLMASGGPSNVVDSTLRLGPAVTATADGLPSALADQDPSDDGVTLTRGRTFTPGTTNGAFDVQVVGTGCLSAWADWSLDGTFAQPADAIVSHQPVTTGTATIAVATPTTLALPTSLPVRWRLFAPDPDGTCTSPELPASADIRGETEDYVFRLTPSPGAPVLTATPPTPSSDPAPSWTFTSPDASATPTCSLTSPAGTSTVLPCTSGTATAGPLGTDPTDQGTYTFSAFVTDTLGRTSPTTTSTYLYDTVAPGSPMFTTTPEDPTNAGTVSWGWTVPSDATARCALVPPGVPLVPTPTLSACPRTGQTFSLAGRPEGTYTLLLAARDAAGNLSATISATVTRDITPPTAAGVTLNTTSPGNAKAVSWTVTVPAQATAVCTLTEADGTVDPGQPCAGTYSVDLNAAEDGTYSLSVVTSDEAGNSAAAVVSPYVLDTKTSPATFTSTPPATGSGLGLHWTFTIDADATAVCTLTEGSVVIATASPCGGTFNPVLGHVAAGPPGPGTATEGNLVLTVSVHDGVGNVAKDATSTYVLDTLAPAAPSGLSVSPTSPGTNASPTWSFTLDAGSTGRCTISDSGGVVIPETTCTGAYSPDLTSAGDGDGTYTLSVIAVDLAGNASNPATGTYVLDRTAGAATLLTSPPADTNDPAAEWTFSTDAGNSPECRFQTPTSFEDWAACASPFDRTLTAEGTYTLWVRAIDGAGNVGLAVASSTDLDTTPPDAPMLTITPTTPATTRTPSWSFTAEDGASTSCSLTGALTLAPATCVGSFTPSLDAQPDGTYRFHVTATDAAGNTSVPASSAYILDTTSQAPVITWSPPSPGSSRSIHWSFTTSDGDQASCRLARAGTVLVPWAPCAGTLSSSLESQPDDTYTFAVRATDALRNVSATVTSDYILDTTAPPVPLITGTPGSDGSNRSPVWVFSSSGGAVVRCRLALDGGTPNAWTPCAGRYTADLTGRPDGTWRLDVQAVDQSGNESAVASSTYVLDTTPPGPPTFTSGGGVSNDPATTWTFVAEPGSTTTCRLTGVGAVLISDWSPCDGTFAAALADKPDGIYLLSVRATDADGNTSPVSSSAFQLDRVAPAAPTLVDQTPSGSDTQPQFSWSTETGSTLQVRAVDGGGSPTWAAPVGFATLDLSGDPAGDYHLDARAMDAAGNLSPTATATYHLVVLASDASHPETGEHDGGHPAVVVPVIRPVIDVRPTRAPVRTTTTVVRTETRLPTDDQKPVPAHPAVDPKPPVTVADDGTHRSRNLIGDIGGGVTTALSSAGATAAFPVALVLLLLGFLTVQNRVDRSDPKLAKAPLQGDDRWISFS